MSTSQSFDRTKIRIMVVDDEDIVLRSCHRILTRLGYQVETTANPDEGQKRILEGEFHLAIVDLKMPVIDGMQLLRAVRESRVGTEVIMITGYSTVKNAVEAMKLGAADYVPKPFDPDELTIVVERVFEKQSLIAENLYLRQQLDDRYRLGNIIGQSPAMLGVFRRIQKVAPTSGTVLITGESGTGKELVARAIHFKSTRKEGPFIVADCSTLAPSLLESELFGHVKGSFTGAERTHKGVFELSDGGTLFLDEISNMSPEIQGKLLRVLESMEFKPVGGEESKRVDVRLIAATNQDLKKMVARGQFRADLFYRLAVVPITLPPLSNRQEDIVLLAWHFLHQFKDHYDKEIRTISPGALDQLRLHAWPGNVRELRNAMERIVIMADGPTVTDKDIAAVLGHERTQAGIPRNLEELKKAKKLAREKAVEQIERAFVLDSLARNNWNVSQAARDIGIQRTNLHALMRKYGIRQKTESQS
ncbi:MAG: sigma-54 dependent transcriptional regulator [Candidatus Krumholzibacteria bacterium]|nr:sigma-54 dependent transcriptional regulator [Candidatus Krumholzibacteria bacterium]